MEEVIVEEDFYFKVEPDEGYCDSCNKQSIPIAIIEHDDQGRYVHLHICKTCLQQIIDTCFDFGN